MSNKENKATKRFLKKIKPFLSQKISNQTYYEKVVCNQVKAFESFLVNGKYLDDKKRSKILKHTKKIKKLLNCETF